MGGAIACGGGDPTGPKASSVTGIAGDNQVGNQGGQLPFPLSLVVLGSNGQPAQGITAAWSVTTGTASLSSSQSTSDVNGTAQTSVTLGGQVGNVTVRATIPGVATPVDYHLTVVQSCAFYAPHTVPGTVNGIITTLDCNWRNQGWYYDFYELTPAVQQGVNTTMSATFDTYLEFWEVRGDSLYPVAGNNDANAGTTNATIQTITAAGDYLIAANTNVQFTTGPYTLTTTVRPQTLTGCSEIYLTRGVTISDNIATADCADTVSGNVFYSDQAGIVAFSGTVLTISQHSTAVNPFLTLFMVDSTGLVAVASNDDSSATNTNAFIQYPVTQSALFVVVPGTASAGETGAYTLAISPSFTASTRVFASAPQRSMLPQFLRQRSWQPLKTQPRPLSIR
jgi:hypothetical protein